MLIILLVFILTTDFKNFHGGKTAYAIAVFAMLSNGGLSVVQKIFGSSFPEYCSSAYVSCSYIWACVISFLLYLLLKRTAGGKTFEPDYKSALHVIGVGGVLAIFTRLNVHAIATVDGVFLFPVYSGGSVILTSLSGVFLFGDRLNAKAKLSLVMGIIAITLINF